MSKQATQTSCSVPGEKRCRGTKSREGGFGFRSGSGIQEGSFLKGGGAETFEMMSALGGEA